MHLETMSVEKKDEWIISQAKLLGENCYQEDSGFTILDAYENNLLYIDRNEVARDWLYSFYVTKKIWNVRSWPVS